MPDFPSSRKRVKETLEELGYTTVRATNLDDIPRIASGEKPPKTAKF